MYKYNKIALIGDSIGIAQLSSIIPRDLIQCIIGAYNRKQHHPELLEIAQDLKVEFLIQPKYKSRKYYQFVEKLKVLAPDLLLCKSYSMVIQNDVLSIVNNKAINFHASLLPYNRGPNPVQWALIKGEKKTGFTLHFITDEIDAGDIIAQKEISIDFCDTWVSLSKKIRQEKGTFLNNEILKILSNDVCTTKQDGVKATTNFRLGEEFPVINFDVMSDLEVYNLIRAQVAPLKGAYIVENGKKVFFNHFLKYDDIIILREKYAH